MGSTTEHGENEIEIPQNLMKFPPLAYLLNCVLTCLNFVRECPLLTVKQPVLQAVDQLFHEVCQYLVDKAVDIRNVGSKYSGDILNNAKKGNKAINRSTMSSDDISSSTDAVEQNMDVLYAQSVAYDMFPHVLLCCESIYSTQPHKIIERIKNYKLKYSSTNIAGVVKGASPFLAPSSNQCTELLGKALAAVLVEGVWPILISGGILKLVSKDNKE